jgi:hypothetical protein
VCGIVNDDITSLEAPHFLPEDTIAYTRAACWCSIWTLNTDVWAIVSQSVTTLLTAAWAPPALETTITIATSSAAVEVAIVAPSLAGENCCETKQVVWLQSN